MHFRFVDYALWFLTPVILCGVLGVMMRRRLTRQYPVSEWDLDYDFQLGRMDASTLLVNYNMGPFTLGGGDAFLQIPQTNTNNFLTEGTCGPTEGTNQVTCKFQQFRVVLGYGGLTRRGFSAASILGIDAATRQLQFATAQTTYNWDCCGVTLEYRRYAIANVRNENLFRFTFNLANIGAFGNLGGRSGYIELCSITGLIT